MLAAIDWPAGTVDPATRRKTGMLIADLATLGVNVSTVPDSPAIPPLAGMGEALGALYVTEGSTLGGQMILHTLAPRIGIDATHGGRFLASYGPSVGPQWRALLAALEAANDDGPLAAAVEAGARATFRAFHAWLMPAFKGNATATRHVA